MGWLSGSIDDLEEGRVVRELRPYSNSRLRRCSGLSPSGWTCPPSSPGARWPESSRAARSDPAGMIDMKMVPPFHVLPWEETLKRQRAVRLKDLHNDKGLPVEDTGSMDWMPGQSLQGAGGSLSERMISMQNLLPSPQ